MPWKNNATYLLDDINKVGGQGWVEGHKPE